MTRRGLQACLPWLALLAALLLLAWLIVARQQGPLRLDGLRGLHADQVGSVQSLSFVLTLPVFVMIMLLIVQVSQLMIGMIVVHYAAYAARAPPWCGFPPESASGENSNCISSYYPDPSAANQAAPTLDPTSSAYGPSAGGMTYLVQPGSPKYHKITQAAVMACMAISPSRDLGFQVPSGAANSDSLKAAYLALAPSEASNQAVPGRLDHKLAYAWNNTAVAVRFFHPNLELPLGVVYGMVPDADQFYFNEVAGRIPSP